MTQTFEELYLTICDGQADNAAYDKRRQAKVAEIADYIRDFLKNPTWAEAVAESMMASAEEMGRIHGNEIHCEVAPRYTTSGNPLPFTI